MTKFVVLPILHSQTKEGSTEAINLAHVRMFKETGGHDQHTLLEFINGVSLIAALPPHELAQVIKLGGVEVDTSVYRFETDDNEE